VWENVNEYYLNRYNKHLPESSIKEGKLKIIRLHYKFNFLNRIRFFKDLSYILEEEKPDLIYVHDIHFNLHNASKYKKQNNQCRLILDFHADYSNSGNNWLSRNILHKVIRNLYLRINLKYIDKIFPVVPASAIFLKEMYGIKQHKMEILPLGVDTDLVRELEDSGSRLEIREILKLTEHDIVIITAGKLGSLKQTDQLIKAFQKIKGSNVRLLVIGGQDQSDPDYFQYLQNLMVQDKRINYLGWMDGDSVVKYLLASDIAVFPSSQSVLWQEAIGAGLALIIGRYLSGKQGTLAQDVDYLNRRNNILILEEKNDKIEEIKVNLVKLIESPEVLARMKRGSLKVTEEFLSYNIIVQQTINN
jgi:glycosyltransferase involved in cell wall biosynthesis